MCSIKGVIFFDVPVLSDPEIFDKPVTMTWTNPACPGGIDYHIPTARGANGTVDLGNIRFLGLSCLGGRLSTLVPRDLTWKHDGSEIGFRMLGFKKVPSTFSSTFGWSEVTQDGGMFGNRYSWSPVDGR